ncbi:hypothetical protein [Dictyobacter aurantiacus]|uniref:Uncharacterized protein n=1 Tax=Dictyobacter aurantiacus TaxID=1936993 RepID=A0A401ZCU6_9CHLR|nr:hypothetical protein [Dictyobacter aurantiacus]GCE04653.1 hypothetical protein KDAU_19820 [Dictyobacter aurantiacus]
MNNILLNLLENDFDNDADIDELFEQLEQFEPPVDMVDRVMQAVSQLPLTYAKKPVSPWSDLEILAIAQ